MSDSKAKKDYRDRKRININERYEVAYWSKKWGVSAAVLKQIVHHLGTTSIEKIERFLDQKK